MPFRNLMMGQLHASARPCLISTVLGSCVAVCLWDVNARMGGMNHFMLPQWDGRGLPSPRFGNIAIPALLRAVLEVGARRSTLVAKVFGGGNVLGQGEMPAVLNVGHRNADYALAALEQEGIPVVAHRLRPTHGLKISFDTRSGDVLLRPLKRVATVNFRSSASIPNPGASHAGRIGRDRALEGPRVLLEPASLRTP